MKRLSIITAVLVSGIIASTLVDNGDPVSAAGGAVSPPPTGSISPILPPLPTVTTTPRPPTTTAPPPTTTIPRPTTTLSPTTTTIPRPTTTTTTPRSTTTLPPTTLPPTTLPPTTLPPTTLPPTTLPPPPDPCPTYPRTNPYAAEVISTRGGKQCWTYIASGDSVTSAHNQWASGIPAPGNPCPNTTRGPAGVGNEPSFSYAFRVFHGAAKFAGGNYYNYARTGYTTSAMRFATPGTTDACANVWGKAAPPFGMVLNTAAWEKSQKRKVAWVTTGGVNNTNWSTMLAEFVKCSFYQNVGAANASGRNLGLFKVTITPNGVAPHVVNGTYADIQALNLLLARGGKCLVDFNVPPIGPGQLPIVIVPAFNLPAVAPGITADVSAMVSGAVAAKIDKIIWVGYYDISPATIDVIGAIKAWGINPAVADWLIPRLGGWGIPTMFPIARDLMVRSTLQANLTALNNAICQGVTAGSVGAPAGVATCTRFPSAGFTAAGDIQNTVMGGMPHPSGAGHSKLATMVLRII